MHSQYDIIYNIAHITGIINWALTLFILSHYPQINQEALAQASTKFNGVIPHTKEAYYYRQVFEELFPECSHLIPYYWMPKWSGNTSDPSAQSHTLNHYVQ
jgi:hypothetical protein